MSEPAAPGNKHPRRSRAAQGLTPAQRAIREAAEGLRNGTIVPSPLPPTASESTGARSTVEVAWPQPPQVEEARSDADNDLERPARSPAVVTTGPLFDVDELYVGRPAIGDAFAYRDRNFNVLATVSPKTSHHSKIDALLAGDGTRHLGERLGGVPGRRGGLLCRAIPPG